MKNIYLLLSVILIAQISFSQESNYQGLKSQGEIPAEFTDHISKKIEDAKAESESGLEKVNRKTKNKFYEMSNFGISQMLQSGQVCFNDTISNYVENVLEEIRSKNHDVPLSIRIYTIKSPVVNAFTTDQGIIFVNTGLLAQLENEAQLAFVICHELIHYMENHVREGFVEDVEIESRNNDYREIRNIDKNLASAKFSRKLEKEADVKGLELFLNTDYNPAEIDGVFDVLLYSYLPFDEIPFDSSILEIGEYQIPDKFFLTELNEIEVDEDEDDSKHTHPNIRKRRSKIESLLEGISKTGQDYLASKDDFFAVRATARYEVLRLQLVSGKYSEALYSAYILEKEYPDNSLPKIAIGEILFGTAIFANSKFRKKVTGYYKKKQGNVQQVYYLLGKMKAKDITLLALRYNYYLHGLYPNNETIESRIIDLCRDLAYYYDMEIEDIEFEKEKTKAVNDSTSVADNEQKKSSVKKVSSKYDRIKSNKSKTKKTTDGYNRNWAAEEIFIGCDCEDQLTEFFEQGQKESDDKKYRLAETGDYQLDEKSRKEQKEYSKIKKKKGRSLGIDKIVIVDPYYIVYNQTSKNDPYKVAKSEREEIEQLEDFEVIAKKAKLEMEILTNYNFEAEDVEKFNDFSLLNEWIGERYLMEDRTNITSSTEEVANIVERYETKYFAWTGVINATYPRRGKWGVMIASIYSVIGIPFGIYYLVTPKKSTSIYFALFNIETGQLMMYEERDIPVSDSDGLLKSQYYDLFNQVKK